MMVNVDLVAVGTDPRISHSHTQVPGPDGRSGFGGACFPKDTKAFTLFDKDLTLIDKCVTINNEYRKPYELDSREQSNNISYGETLDNKE